MNEFEIIRKYLQKLSLSNKYSFNLNDDVFFDKKRKLVVSVDTYNEGIHFLNFHLPNLVIKKIIRSSISDLICKGVKPMYYFISAAGTKGHFTKKNLRLISQSLLKEQKKYNLLLSGGDTTYSKSLSFSVTTIGFTNDIVKRNNASINDDIYVTGNIGDSFMGLNIIKNKIRLKGNQKKYFINKFYCPELPYKLTEKILIIANSSIDVSDGLFTDLKRMINNQKLSFELYLDKIPTSNKLNIYLKKHKKKKIDYVFNGDDYQILFTSPKKNRNLINSISIKTNHKITLIGQINKNTKKNRVLIGKKEQILPKSVGYSHKF